MKKNHRDTIFVEQAEILQHQAHEGAQFTLRVKAPEIAARAEPGSFAHIQVDPNRPLRRPISIMRCHHQSGIVEFLYKVFGEGTTLLSKRKVGEKLDILGPIGTPFALHKARSRPLLIGGGVGIPPMIFLAERMHAQKGDFQPFVIMGSEVPFPFQSRPSQIMLPSLPADVIAAMPLLEDWGVASRLASLQGYPGCYEGYVTDLARHWLDGLDDEQRSEVEIFSCGPHPMLEAVAKLAAEYGLPCQVSMEEFMACGVGGCAGCVVEVQADDGPAMKRVCVDGPVFDAEAVFG
ncbi:MAG: dihydroorotate dehydrogenase electron transfer subunit [Pseudomonadota bacterium]